MSLEDGYYIIIPNLPNFPNFPNLPNPLPNHSNALILPAPPMVVMVFL